MEMALCLGSNSGDRLRFLQQARDALVALDGVTLLAQSPVYETDPVGVREQYADLAFLNAVLILESNWPPDGLSAAMHAIEDRLGRVRSEDRYAPRTIDIDMLYAADTRSDDPALVLPHPRWDTRRFVVQPLTDVRPALALPDQQRTVREILAALPPHPAARRFITDW